MLGSKLGCILRIWFLMGREVSWNLHVVSFDSSRSGIFLFRISMKKFIS